MFKEKADIERNKLISQAKAMGTYPTSGPSSISGIRDATEGRTRLPISGEEFEQKFEPAFDWCLIKMSNRDDSLPEAMKKSGIIEPIHIRQQARNKDGIVVKMGPHQYDADYKKTSKPDINVGDRVYYGAWAGQETPCPDGYLMVRSKDLSLHLDPDTRLEWI